MRVGRIPLAHLSDSVSEQPVSIEYVGALGEETEDQPRHEVVHVVPTYGGAPVWVVL